MTDYKTLREKMVGEQLAARGIADKDVLDAFAKVERHRFIPGNLKSAYEDHPLPIGDGQTISQPYMVALMTEKLEVDKTSRVLEIGTGSGYQAAILCELACEVYSVERFGGLAERAKRILDELGYTNINIKVGDGTEGWPGHAPYDGIIVTAGAPDVPASLVEQLSQRGRLVIPVGGRFSQMLKVAYRRGRETLEEDVCGCVFVPLVGKYGWPASD